MHDFTYHRPAGLADAERLYRAAADGKFLAGGQTLIPTLKQRLAAPTDVIDLGAIAELRGIRVGDGLVSIGATTTHGEVAASAEIAAAIPALAALAANIGDPQVRNLGTIGGSIANNDPAADYPAALLGLDAVIHTSQRQIPADAFFTGMFETALEEGELVTRVDLPVPRRAGYVKFANPASRYAIVGVMAAVTAGGPRVAVTGAAACVFRWTEAEAALAASFSPDALTGLGPPDMDFNGDIHASAAYRAHLVTVIARRAVAAAAG